MAESKAAELAEEILAGFGSWRYSVAEARSISIQQRKAVESHLQPTFDLLAQVHQQVVRLKDEENNLGVLDAVSLLHEIEELTRPYDNKA